MSDFYKLANELHNVVSVFRTIEYIKHQWAVNVAIAHDVTIAEARSLLEQAKHSPMRLDNLGVSVKA